MAEKYTAFALKKFVEDSLRNLRMEAIDLLQLHCPPTPVYYMPEVFEGLDTLVKAGKIKNYGVSVEKVEEAIKAIVYPGVKTAQIIFNMFRQRPSEVLFHEAKKREVGVIARVPLASGMLSGRMTKSTRFHAEDHRSFNRAGKAFDRGETFSGVDFAAGLKAVDELRKLLPGDMTMAQFALRWILMFEAVSCAIPGGRHPDQVEENCLAADYPRLSKQIMRQVQEVYEAHIKDGVHQRW